MNDKPPHDRRKDDAIPEPLDEAENSIGPKRAWETGPVTEEYIKQGSPASRGIAIGRAYIVDRRRLKVPRRHITPDEVGAEQQRFRAALADAHEQLERVKGKLAKEGEDHFHILEAHQLIMKDEHLADATIKNIAAENINAEWALMRTVEQVKRVFDAIEDDYFRDRRSDVDFVSERIMRTLLGAELRPVRPPPDAIVVAHDLAPSDTAQLHQAAVAALVTDAGSRTSHTAIIARAHDIPAVVGLEDISSLVGNGDLVIVDGISGQVIINPTPNTVSRYRERARHEAAAEQSLLANRDLVSETTDGHRVRLLCNVEEFDELASATEHGAEGIGLYRTEFLFLARNEPPTEDEQYEHAVTILRAMGERVSTFRTFDLGGDKGGPFQNLITPEINPALGMRSIRICLTEEGIPLFKTQLRALLRAARHGPLRIMFPMISGLYELRRAKAILEECKQELRSRGVAFNDATPVGIMIEMPSAALTADLLAQEVDFFSIGTNDLIQYLLAIDRVNEHVSYLYRPMHPALLRLVEQVTLAGKRANIPVSMCGEMAGEPLMALVLLGLGLSELSMNAQAIPLMKSVIRASSMSDARRLAREALTLHTADEIEELLREHMSTRFPANVLLGPR